MRILFAVLSLALAVSLLTAQVAKAQTVELIDLSGPSFAESHNTVSGAPGSAVFTPPGSILGRGIERGDAYGIQAHIEPGTKGRPTFALVFMDEFAGNLGLFSLVLTGEAVDVWFPYGENLLARPTFTLSIIANNQLFPTPTTVRITGLGQVSAVPEPSASDMLLLGLSMAAVVAWRRRTAA